jgi:hypothetical protein
VKVNAKIMSETPTATIVAATAAATTIPDEEVTDEYEDAEGAKDIRMTRMITLHHMLQL